MASVTTNFGFDVPTSSDLVKNGATAISTLGQDIDTFLAGGVGFAAGKNKIINGDFSINQRAFTSMTASATLGFDRWLQQVSDGTVTYSAQTFTAGTAPVTGYEGINFARQASTGQTLSTATSILVQRIEDVRTFANQSVTVSFWAKASGTPKVAVEFQQFFGTGGSASVNTYGGQVTLSTSWQRYSVTFTGASILPTMAGKTITSDSSLRLNLWTSAGSNFNARTGSIGIQTATIDFWGVQVESGLTASPFQTATGTLQGELAACQRYYAKSYAQATAPATNSSANGLFFAQSGATVANTDYFANVPLPVTMRANPTVTIYSFTSSQTGRVSDGTGTDLAAGSGATNLINDTRFTVQNNSGLVITASKNGFVFHYTVSAEL
jgi:hypothetical protein